MENTSRTYLSNDLIIKYLKKELTSSETEKVTVWLQEDRANQDFLFGLEELYQVYCWDELKLSAQTAEEWAKIEEQIRKRKTKSRRLPAYKNVLKYAAILIGIGLTTTYIFWQTQVIKELQSPVSISTAKGERSHITLPDGTKVWLNACSNISYTNAVFSGERRVKMSGEAYFEVAKNPDAPFVVESKKISTRVLGTKFNIRAYEDENHLTATLLEGSIQLSSTDCRFPRNLILKPGEKIICYDDNGVTEYVNDRKTAKTIDWISGKLHFDNRPLELIARELEKHFDTRITFTEESLKQECFTCEFENGETLYDILNVLILTNKFTYSMHEKEIILSAVN